ncbi:hypothetical protein YW3DRAFT_05487 [Streptomyces sp. MnatMP-M77]|nr:hypothetical protein YW3DRAFT_05487 [Streptomyces sp. MnatMP-M77]
MTGPRRTRPRAAGRVRRKARTPPQGRGPFAWPSGAAGALRRHRRTGQAAFAFVAYMSTYSWPDSRITSAITESVTARST